MKSKQALECYPVVNHARFHNVSSNGDAILNVGACDPSPPYPDDMRTGGFEQAKKSDIQQQDQSYRSLGRL
jgi:hypothetical protein